MTAYPKALVRALSYAWKVCRRSACPMRLYVRSRRPHAPHWQPASLITATKARICRDYDVRFPFRARTSLRSESGCLRQTFRRRPLTRSSTEAPVARSAAPGCASKQLRVLTAVGAIHAGFGERDALP